MNRSSWALALVGLLACDGATKSTARSSSPGQESSPEDASPVATESSTAGFAPNVTADELRADVSLLASDELGGRGTPSDGLDRAAEHIVTSLKKAGATEGFGEGLWEQRVWWNLLTRPSDDARIEVGGAALDLSGWDIRLPQLSPERATATVAVIGDTFPKTPGIGRVALVNASSMPPRDAFRQAGRLGYDGLVLLGADEAPLSGRRPLSIFVAAVPTARVAAAKRALTDGVEMTLQLHAEDARLVRNVAGVVRGRETPDEYVVVSAHYDHLGIVRNTVYNGANDDASGVASFLAIARDIASASTPPRRSVLFVGFFGEERGLVGSRWFRRQPPIALHQIVANVNIEMVGRPEISKDGSPVAWMTGPTFSTLPDVVMKAAATQGVIEGDKGAMQTTLFYQSDNAALAAGGVPAHSISSGDLDATYHQPNDDAETLDYEGMAKLVAGIGAGVWALADAPAVPVWGEDGAGLGLGRCIRVDGTRANACEAAQWEEFEAHNRVRPREH